MQILLLDINYKYLNPTKHLLSEMIIKYMGAKPFGPGYVSEEILHEGIHKFVQQNGRFDLVMASEQIIFADLWQGKIHEQALRQNYSYNFEDSQLNSRLSLCQSLKEILLPRVALLVETDYYNININQIERLEKYFELVVGWNAQFVKRIEELPHLKSEKFYKYASDNWVNFAKNNHEKIVPIVHFLSNKEFNFKPLNARPALITVPGVQYARRQLVSSKLSKVESLRDSSYRLSSRVGSRVMGIPKFKDQSIKLRRRLFQTQISRVKFAYTCGSGLDWPLRKFFEIPALGTLLLASPSSGFRELGFKDRYNFFQCEPEHAVELARELTRYDNDLQKTSDRSRALIRDKHSFLKRLEQLHEALTLFKHNRWHGAIWSDGEMLGGK